MGTEGLQSRIRWEVAVTLVVAAFSFLSLGATMRETDQASLLEGALLLARGEASPVSAAFYNYDKQFVTYWITAAAIKCWFRAGHDAEAAFHDLTAAGNLGAGLILWAGMLFLVWRAERGGGGRVWLFATALLAPSFLLSGSLLSSNVISGGFLGLLAGVLGSRARDRPGIGSALVILGSSFAAVGARADAVLCLPFLCWITVPHRSWRELITKRNHWMGAAGAVAALAIGRVLTSGSVVDRQEGFFVPEVALAYFAFGLGGAGLVLVWMLAAFGRALRKPAAAGRKGLLGAGLCFALLPLGYYGPQLFSPRHLLTTVWVILFFVLFARGRALLRMTFAARTRKLMTAACALAALIPVFAGLELIEIQRPRLSWGRSTLYPTADGLWPMGAYAKFLGNLREAAREPIDHNQELWSALSRSEFPEAGGKVPLFSTPMRSYFRLAAALRHQEVSVWEHVSSVPAPFLILDERLMRRNPASAAEAGLGDAAVIAQLRARPKRVISSLGEAQPILRIDLAGDGVSDPDVEMRLAVAELFGGDDFRVLEVEGKAFAVSDAERGRLLVFFSARPFQLRQTSAEGGDEEAVAEAIRYGAPGRGAASCYGAPLPGPGEAKRRRIEIEGAAVEEGAKLYVAVSTLMRYMSVQRWK